MSFSLLNRSVPRACKPHRCIWCGYPTIVGSKYVREASVYDGQMQNLAFHEACVKASDDYFNEVGEGEFPDDGEMPFFALYQIEAQPPSPVSGEAE